MESNKLTWKEIETKLFCVGIPAIGLTILFTHLPRVNPLTNIELIIFMVINIFADLLSVSLPNGVTISLSYPIMICAMLLFGPIAGMWVYIPGTIINHIIKKRAPYKIIFNISQISICIFIAAMFMPPNLSFNISKDFLWAMGMVITFDIINFALVSKMVTIRDNTTFFKFFIKIWLNQLGTVRPIYYSTGVIMAICYQAQGIPGGLLVVVPVLGVFFQLNTQKELETQTSKANTDALTGLCNRHALSAWWEKELPFILNTSQNLHVIMIDIDDFKKVNDRFGHDLGDEVLKMVGLTLIKCIRRTDCIFRYGGEEFVVLLPETDKINAEQIAHRILTSISQAKIPHLDNISVTVSLGLSSLTTPLIEEKNDLPNELIRRADNAMYLAKQHGKNQIQIYT